MLARTICVIILFCYGTAIPLLAQQPDATTAAAILALERQWVDAQSRNDNPSLNLIMDNAVVYVEYGKLMTKGDYLSRIKSYDPLADAVVMEPVTVRTFGNTAIVTGTYRETLRRSGKRSTKRWRFVDTWTFKKQGWVLIAAASTPIHE